MDNIMYYQDNPMSVNGLAKRKIHEIECER